MSTFCAVDDAALIQIIKGAKKRIVFIAPGLHEPVAQALGERFRELGRLDVTVVLDPDEEVCRIGFGDAKGLKLVHELAKAQGFYVRSQPGLRVGVLLADEATLVWSPTPRSVEAPPQSQVTEEREEQAQVANADWVSPAAATVSAPNGLLLGAHPGEQLAKAVAAEGTDTAVHAAEIGKAAVTPTQVKDILEALEKNPPIPVDLARVTRVFSTKLQFVEWEIKGAKISRTQLSIPSELLNADAKGEIQGLLQSRLRAFADLKNEEIEVTAYVNGEPVLDKGGKPVKVKVSEASLLRERNDIEKTFLHDITGFGRLIAKDEKQAFQARVDAYKEQLIEHSKGLRQLIDKQAKQILDEAVTLIMERAARSGQSKQPDPEVLGEALGKMLSKAKAEEPQFKMVFKDVTYEQTQNPDFRERVKKAIPASKQKQLGEWSDHFDAARESAKGKA